MRTLIWAIRSAFCKHEFKHEEVEIQTKSPNGGVIAERTMVSRTCKKCGWHKKYWKW